MRQPHALVATIGQGLVGPPWVGYCRCGTEFHAWTKQGVRDAHREHKAAVNR